MSIMLSRNSLLYESMKNIAIQELRWIVALSKGMLAHERHFLITASFPLPLSTK
jgi:hypothetical protein